jgi:hypothetical protein
MIAEGAYPPIHIDLGKDEPGMILQREYNEGGYLVWRDVMKDSDAEVKSPVDIDALFPGVYRLVLWHMENR